MQKALAAVIVAVCLSPLVLVAETHSHGTDYAKSLASPARKLEIDDTLRKGMGNVAAALRAKNELVRASRLTGADYSSLAKNVRTELAVDAVTPIPQRRFAGPGRGCEPRAGIQGGYL